MVNLVMVRIDQRMYCKDVLVVRGANCWTNHQLVRAKLSLKYISKKVGAQGSSFSVYKLSVPAN